MSSGGGTYNEEKSCGREYNSLNIFGVLLRRLPVGSRLAEPVWKGRNIREVDRRETERITYLSLWVMLGSLSFRRAISVCINLLYALSFFFAPPAGVDLAVNQR